MATCASKHSISWARAWVRVSHPHTIDILRRDNSLSWGGEGGGGEGGGDPVLCVVGCSADSPVSSSLNPTSNSLLLS